MNVIQIPRHEGACCANAVRDALKTADELVFEPGAYHFYVNSADVFSAPLSNSNYRGPVRAAILINNKRNVRLAGKDTEFIFHGDMVAVAVVGSENVHISGIKIDWDPPAMGEGTVVCANAEYADVAIDKTAYPYVVVNGKLAFETEEGTEEYWGAAEFNIDSGLVERGSGDRFRSTSQEELPNGLIRFHGRFDPPPRARNLLALRHTLRVHPGVYIHLSKNVTIEHTWLYACRGLGFLMQFSENLTLRDVHAVPNEERGRRVASCHDDGMHFSNCRGHIEVDGCSYYGLMDDAINIHGTSIKVESILDAHTVEAAFIHHQSQGFDRWAEMGHEVQFLCAQDLRPLGACAVESFEPLSWTTCRIRFASPIPAEFVAGDALENLTNTPSAHIHHCHFGAGRARGVLLKTPKKIVLEHCVFEYPGSSILISGDANGWYESGACRDVTIRNNVFTDASVTSMYQFCGGVISIYPEIPKPGVPFHENIRIEDNLFSTFGDTVLYVFSAKNVTFARNMIIRSRRPAPEKPRPLYVVRDSAAVDIRDNRVVGAVEI